MCIFLRVRLASSQSSSGYLAFRAHDVKHQAEQHPSRRAEDGAHLRMTAPLLDNLGSFRGFRMI
jgi:hypothetical protein